MAVAYHHLVEHPIGKDSELDGTQIGNYQSCVPKEPESPLNRRVTGGYVEILTSCLYGRFSF